MAPKKSNTAAKSAAAKKVVKPSTSAAKAAGPKPSKAAGPKPSTTTPSKRQKTGVDGDSKLVKPEHRIEGSDQDSCEPLVLCSIFVVFCVDVNEHCRLKILRLPRWPDGSPGLGSRSQSGPRRSFKEQYTRQKTLADFVDCHVAGWLSSVEPTHCAQQDMEKLNRRTLFALLAFCSGWTPGTRKPAEDKQGMIKALASAYKKRGSPLRVTGWNGTKVLAYIKWQCAMLQAGRLNRDAWGGFGYDLPKMGEDGAPAALPEAVLHYVESGELQSSPQFRNEHMGYPFRFCAARLRGVNSQGQH